MKQIVLRKEKELLIENSKRAKRVYLTLFWGALIVLCFAVIAPYAFGWMRSATTPPKEAVAKLSCNGVFCGTGFLVTEEYMLTARHVIEDNPDLTYTASFQQASVPFDVDVNVEYVPKYNKPSDAELEQIAKRAGSFEASQVAAICADYFNNDFALLKLSEPVTNITPLKLGDSDELKTRSVLILGYGLDDWSDPAGKITNDSFHGQKKLFKLDASVNKGHSGSPVMTCDKDGEPMEVIGICVGTLDEILRELTKSSVAGEKVVTKINSATSELNVQYDLQTND